MKKTVGSTVTRFVYNDSGTMIAEYTSSLTTPSKEYVYGANGLLATTEGATGSTVKYPVADHLGTPRLWMNKTGGVVSRHDYFPFGDEIFVPASGPGLGGRLASQGYTTTVQADGTRQQFTSYERDSETAMDFAKARQLATTYGRFVTVDRGPFTPADPQNWNRFPYVQNNPLKFVDPNGESLTITGADAKYLVQELENETGLDLSIDEKGNVSIIGSSSVDTDDASAAKLAARLTKIIADADVQVQILTVNGSDAVPFDKAVTSQLDVADYKVVKRDAPELAGPFLGHILTEYHMFAQTKGLNEIKTNADLHDAVEVAHAKGRRFENKLVSGRFDKEVEPRGETTINSTTKRFTYTSVAYDMVWKGTINNKASGTLLRVEKVE